MASVERGGSAPKKENPWPALRREFVENRLNVTRKKALTARLGEEAAETRLATETELLTRVVDYLETPPSKREERVVFSKELRDEAKDAGLSESEAAALFNRGSTIHSYWLGEKHNIQRQNAPFSGPGTDPHVYLDDDSHRRGTGRH